MHAHDISLNKFSVKLSTESTGQTTWKTDRQQKCHCSIGQEHKLCECDCRNSRFLFVYFFAFCISILQDELDRSKTKIEIPALAAGASTSNKMSKEFTIQAIEAKLRMLESRKDDFEVNRSATDEPPLIQRYQYNKSTEKPGQSHSHNNRMNSGRTRPYDRRPRQQRR